MRQRLLRCVIVLAYWAIVVYFLRRASPVFVDGGGPTPSFYWGDAPLPDFGEYSEHLLYYDCIYWIPYLLAGLVITVVGYGFTPLVTRWVRLFRPGTFAGAAVVTFVLLVLVALASDAGGRLGLWHGPLFLLHGRFDSYLVLTLARVLLPACLLSGLLELGRLGRTSA